MDVAEQEEPVGGRPDRLRSKPAAEQRTVTHVAPIEPAHIRVLDPHHRDREIATFLGDAYEQVEVCRHQAVGVNFDEATACHAGREREELPTVCSGGKDDALAQTAVVDVVPAAGTRMADALGHADRSVDGGVRSRGLHKKTGLGMGRPLAD